MKRVIIRGVLLISILISIGATLASIWLFGYAKVEVWNIVAASLAVTTAIISAWITETQYERQEDALQPYPYPTLDAYSRTHLFQLRVSNMGGSTAYDICLRWDKPLLDVNGNPVRFSQRDPEIPLLLPNASVATLIGVSHQFLNKYSNAVYSGEVEFKGYPTSSNVIKHKFYLNAEMYRGLPVITSEEQDTHDKLQRLPDEISEVARELERLRYDLKKAYHLAEEEELLEKAIEKAKELGQPIPNSPESQY